VLGTDNAAVSLEPVVAVPIRTSGRSLSPRLSYAIAGRRLDWEIGADADLQQFRPRAERPDASTQDLFRDRMALSAGAYTAMTIRPTPRFSVTPGVRQDFYFEADKVHGETGPRLAARLRTLGELWLKTTVGYNYTQMASMPVAVPGFEGFGLDTFGTQSSWQAALGAERPLWAALSLDITGYYQRFQLTDLNSMFTVDPNDPSLLEKRDGEAYGVELMLRRPQQMRLYGWLAYTWSKSKRLVGAGRGQAWSDWDQRHVANLVAGYRFGRGYSLGSRFHVNTGRPYPVFDERSPGPPEYRRLPTFYQLDVRADKRMVFDRYVLDVYLEVVNTTLSRQVFDLKRNDQGALTEKAYRIVLPSLGVHAEW
jgi:hypothetical protein